MSLITPLNDPLIKPHKSQIKLLVSAPGAVKVERLGGFLIHRRKKRKVRVPLADKL